MERGLVGRRVREQLDNWVELPERAYGSMYECWSRDYGRQRVPGHPWKRIMGTASSRGDLW